LLRKGKRGAQSFEGDFGQGVARFVDVGEEENLFVHRVTRMREFVAAVEISFTIL